MFFLFVCKLFVKKSGQLQIFFTFCVKKGLFALFMEVFFINSVFSYAILPLNLITDEKYRTLTSDEKLLYVLLLNRVNFSKKNLNNFSDSNGIFVYYSNKQIQNHLNCCKSTAIKALNNLEKVGLIKKEYQRKGMPIKIYVNNIRNYERDTNIPTLPKTLHKENPVSFDIGLAQSRTQLHRANFGEMKNKRRSANK